jgi:hypothetical protein
MALANGSSINPSFVVLRSLSTRTSNGEPFGMIASSIAWILVASGVRAWCGVLFSVIMTMFFSPESRSWLVGLWDRDSL